MKRIMMANWSNNAKVLLEARYLGRDVEGNIVETPDQMLHRVAKVISDIEASESDRRRWYHKFLEIMDNLYFLPNTPTLVNAGRELGQLSACFCLPIVDDISAIFEAVKQSAIIHKSGGGTGFNFSALRPKGTRVGSTSGIASGPVSFMACFDAVTNTIKQGGIRRGANIGILNDSHQDIYEFVNCKRDMDVFSNFNISVAISNRFLQAVERNDSWFLVNPIHKVEKRQISARELFLNICENAWETGEPGVIFIDTINKYNPTPWFGRIESTNPCGEQPLLPFESCNLGSIDVSRLASDGKMNYDKLEEVVQVAIRFLDDVIDVNKYPRVRIERKTKKTRKIGLGIMGWADALIRMGIRYDAHQALVLASEMMSFIKSRAKIASNELAIEKGICPAFEGRRARKQRNATLLTIAPTGSLSILADCSSSIEPVYDISYGKRILDGTIINLGDKYAELDRNLIVTAKEIKPEFHVRMQAIFQKYCCNAVSKTINLPKSATVEDVQKAIFLAWRLGCKGITVYREGSREEAPLISTEGLGFNECDSGKCEVI